MQLNSLSLKNFRKHEDLAVTFVNGLNTIRGDNEAGKTTLIEGLAYAWFGAKGLRKDSTLDDVVTFGKPVSALKVEASFTLENVEYIIKRGKSGAEMRFGSDTVTGQTEVTKKMEALLGCSADVATKLLLAKQGDIQGALKEGPSAPVKLIEVLSNFELIGELIDLIEAKLPSGNIKNTEMRLAQLKLDSEQVVERDTTTLDSAIELETGIVNAVAAKRENIEAELSELDIVAARALLNNHGALHAATETLHSDLKKIETNLQEEEPTKPDTSVLPSLREKQEARKHAVELAVLKAKFDKFKPEVLWEGTFESLQAAVAKSVSDLADMRKTLGDDKLKLKGLEGQVISDTTCKLCQKDLKDVPEVQLINNKLYPQIDELRHSLTLLQDAISDAEEDLEAMNGAVFNQGSAEKFYAGMGKHIEIKHDVVPAQATWITVIEDASADYADEIAKIERQDKAWLLWNSRRDGFLSRQTEVTSQIAVNVKSLAAMDIESAADTVRAYQAKERDLTALKDDLNTAQRRLDAAKAALATFLAVTAEAQKRVDGAKVELDKVTGELEAMNRNNALIKKLRNAKPQIAAKLWSVVLGSVSHYFSDMRGTALIVTRDDEGFKVNGKGISGLSGSTLDILGLAIRIALSRTFLPAVSFLQLDEPAAACDDSRETSMLGLIAACNFSQVLLVTHSALADAFSAQVILLGDTNA